MTKNSTEIVEAYFAAFNAGDTQKMLSYLHPEVQHEINQGQIQVGLEAFKKFMAHMDDCYKEQLKDMAIFSSTQDAKFKGAFSTKATKVAGTFTDRISAEYDVHGTYLKTDGSLPEAKGQKYVIRAGSFFEVKDGKISRVTTYYNLPKWIEMVKN